MTAWRQAGLGMLGVIARDAGIYFSHRRRPLIQAAIALLSLTLFYYVSRLVGGRRFETADAYFSYVVVGLALLHALTATLAVTPTAVRTELLTGTFERLVVSATGPVACIIGMAVFPALVALAGGVMTIVFAAIIFGMPIAGPEAVLAVPAAALAMFAFLPFALIVAAVVLVFKQAGNIAGLFVVGLSLVGGVYYPPDLLPGAIAWLSDVQPFTYALDLLRHLIVGEDTEHAPALDVAMLVAFPVVLTPLAVALLGVAIERCRRRGTLIEY